MSTDDLLNSLRVHFPDIFTIHGTGEAPDYSSIDLANRRIDAMLHVLRQQQIDNARIRNSAIPISCLPPEILSHIFVAAVTDEVIRKPAFSTVVPLRLSHVCHTWRTLAFDLSEIWAVVHCRVAKRKTSMQARHLDDWLTRSKERLLSIRISFEDELSWTEPKVIFITLLPYSRRWKNLDLVIMKSCLPCLELVQGKVENLESLSIRVPSRNSDANPGLYAFFAEAPRLRKVVLKCADYILPWAQFTSITLLQPSVTQVLTVLQYCPLLICGNFFELKDDPDWEFTTYPPHSVLEQLSISLTESEPVPIDGLLDQLMLPKLRHLTLILCKHDWSPLNPIEALVDRSGCPLSSLEIGGPTLSDDEIIDFLQLFAHLVHFNNHNHPFITSKDDDVN